MDKEFLMDYEAREKDEIKKFVQKFREGKISDRFPSPDTLKLNEPYTKSIAGEVIWSQIPFLSSPL